MEPRLIGEMADCWRGAENIQDKPVAPYSREKKKQKTLRNDRDLSKIGAKRKSFQ